MENAPAKSNLPPLNMLTFCDILYIPFVTEAPVGA